MESRLSVADKVLPLMITDMKKPYREKMKFDLSVEGGYGINWILAKP